MSINVFGNSSNFSENKTVTSLFIQKLYLRTKYLESNIEEDIDMKNQFRIEIYKIRLASQKLLQRNIMIIYSTIQVQLKIRAMLISMIKI